MSTIGILADDLTGALDCAGTFVQKKNRVTVHLAAQTVGKSDVAVIDTDTRNATADCAYMRVKQALCDMRSMEIPLVYKKVDSTLRGNLGAELQAVFDYTRFRLVVLAPALIQAGRYTKKGVHYVHGRPIDQTEYGSDPNSPVYHARIADVIHSQTSIHTVSLFEDDLSKGPNKMAKTLDRLGFEQPSIVICDATRLEHLRDVVAASQRITHPTLLCGSAGLCEHMTVRAADHEAYGKKNPFTHKSGLLIVYAGMASETKTQMLYTASVRDDIEYIKCDIKDEKDANYEETCKKIEHGLMSGRHVMIDAGGEHDVNNRTQCLTHCHQENVTGRKRLASLANMVARAMDRQRPAGLVLIGGDTARRILVAIGTTIVEPIHFLRPLIPLSLLRDGRYSSMMTVTKAGGFGTKKTLLHIIDDFEQMKKDKREIEGRI